MTPSPGPRRDGFYLLDHPNPRHPYYDAGARTVQLIVVHTGENNPDLAGVDEGAENLAAYGASTDRDASWHCTVDSNSRVPMLPDTYVAYHVRDWNSHSWGIEQATQAAAWRNLPAAFVAGMVENCAAEVGAACLRFGIPARRLTAAQAAAGLAGIVAHADLDPARRSDPGADYPWSTLLSRAAYYAGQPDPGGLTVSEIDQLLKAHQDDRRFTAGLLEYHAAEERRFTRRLVWNATGKLLDAIRAGDVDADALTALLEKSAAEVGATDEAIDAAAADTTAAFTADLEHVQAGAQKARTVAVDAARADGEDDPAELERIGAAAEASFRARLDEVAHPAPPAT